MWTFLKGFAHTNEQVQWKLSSGPGKANGLDGEEGVAICLYPNSRQKTQPFTLAAAKQMIAAKGEEWLRPNGKDWQINLSQMKELWPHMRQHAWLRGSVVVNPEFVQHPDGVFATDAALPVILLIVTPDMCEEIMTSPKKPEKQFSQPPVNDDVELIREVNGGAYGLVWEGCQKSLNRKVAVKVIKADMAEVATAMQHAKVLAKCSHPNVITVHYVASVRLPTDGKVVDGVVMEWLDGKTLRDRLAESAPLSLRDFEELSSSIISGLRHIHDQGIAHGDLHTGNVMLTAQGIKLIDIDFSKSEVLSRLTSQSLAEMTEHDISELRFLLNRAIKKSVIDVNLIEKHESAIRGCQSLSDAMAAVTALLEDCRRTPKSSGKSEHQIPTSRPDVEAVSKKPLDMLQSLGIQANDGELLVAAAKSILSGDNNRAVLSVPSFVEDLAKKGCDYQSVMDSIETLRDKSFVATSSEQHSRYMTLTPLGLDAYLRCFDDKYSHKVMSISAAIVFHGLTMDQNLSNSLQLPIIFIRHVMDVLALHDLCRVTTTSSGRSITTVSAKLRRAAEKDKEGGFIFSLRR